MNGHTVTLNDVENIDGPGPWWFACDHPEAPADEWVIWDWGCAPCVMSLGAAAALNPNAPSTTAAPAGQHTSTRRLMLIDALTWRAVNDYPPIQGLPCP